MRFYEYRNKIASQSDFRNKLAEYYSTIAKSATNMMDDLDFSIIEALQKNGRKRYTEIAKELGITEGTVRNRVARLLDDQVLQVIGLIDPHQMGYDAPAMIAVSVQPAFLETAAAQIAQFPEVSYLIMVSGEYDLMVEVFCADREHLSSFIREKLQKIEGIQRTQTYFILHTYKMAHGARTNNKVGS